MKKDKLKIETELVKIQQGIGRATKVKVCFETPVKIFVKTYIFTSKELANSFMLGVQECEKFFQSEKQKIRIVK